MMKTVELVETNLAALRENSKGMENITSVQGDATDLSRFPDNAFDVTLIFGPMYHLYEPDEVNCAIDEAIRVTNPVEWITTTGVDGMLEPVEKQPGFSISDEDFKVFAQWYLAFSEKRELLGATNHLLYICRKETGDKEPSPFSTNLFFKEV